MRGMGAEKRLFGKEEDASDGERLQSGRGQRLHGGPTSGPHMSTSVKDESKRGTLSIQKFKVVSVYAHGSTPNIWWEYKVVYFKF
jgi:hypothetical protein